MTQKIIHNRCRCRQCEDIIESVHRHDFVSCKCGNIFTDGGKAYIRRGAKDLEDIEDLSEFEQFPDTNPSLNQSL